MCFYSMPVKIYLEIPTQHFIKRHTVKDLSNKFRQFCMSCLDDVILRQLQDVTDKIVIPHTCVCKNLFLFVTCSGGIRNVVYAMLLVNTKLLAIKGRYDVVYNFSVYIENYLSGQLGIPGQ